MAQAARIATATVTVVVRARGALMGSTSSSTSPTTASASARPTNTTNAYIFVPPSRRAARRSHQVRLQVRRLVTAVREDFLVHIFWPVRNVGTGRRSNQSDVRRPGARPGLPEG